MTDAEHLELFNQGFVKIAQAHGLDPEALLKVAQSWGAMPGSLLGEGRPQITQRLPANASEEAIQARRQAMREQFDRDNTLVNKGLSSLGGWFKKQLGGDDLSAAVDTYRQEHRNSGRSGRALGDAVYRFLNGDNLLASMIPTTSRPPNFKTQRDLGDLHDQGQDLMSELQGLSPEQFATGGYQQRIEALQQHKQQLLQQEQQQRGYQDQLQRAQQQLGTFLGQQPQAPQPQQPYQQQQPQVPQQQAYRWRQMGPQPAGRPLGAQQPAAASRPRYGNQPINYMQQYGPQQYRPAQAQTAPQPVWTNRGYLGGGNRQQRPLYSTYSR